MTPGEATVGAPSVSGNTHTEKEAQMTQNKTRKAAAKKAAAKADKPSASDPQPMDTAPTGGSTPHAPVTQRPAYALSTLTREVDAIFGEVPHEFSGPSVFRVLLDVTFDLSTLDPEDGKTLARLLALAEDDLRIREVLVDEAQVLVSLRSHPIRQESRMSFGLAAAHDILMEAGQ